MKKASRPVAQKIPSPLREGQGRGAADKALPNPTSPHPSSPARGEGFSLVELSIVLVILGLLVGGILAGQSLIRASELRAVGAEYSRWTTAIHAFRDKYMALPGDMANATSFWGKDNAKCSTASGAADTPGTCNGDGNSQFALAGAANATGETYRLWQQLALAGLIEGAFTGNAGPINEWDMVAGTNSPVSKMTDASWGMREYISNSVNAGMFTISLGNWLQFGKDAGGSDNGNAALRSEEAWNIDTKLDDGAPARGKLQARFFANCTTASAGSQLDALYKLDTAGVSCTLIFPHYLE